MQHIIYILQCVRPSAGPRAYAHYIRPQKAHPSLTNCISSKLQPIQLLCMHTYFMQHIIYILQRFGPSAGPRTYAHYIRPQKAHPSLTNYISAKVLPFQLLCRHTYNMQHIIYILQCVGPSAGPRACAHYIRPQKAHPSLTNCISSNLQPIQLLCMHTYFMQHIIYILQRFGPSAGPRTYAHYIRPQKAHPSLTNYISAKVLPFQLLYRHTYNIKHFTYILQSFDPLADLRAY